MIVEIREKGEFYERKIHRILYQEYARKALIRVMHHFIRNLAIPKSDILSFQSLQLFKLALEWQNVRFWNSQITSKMMHKSD